MKTRIITSLTFVRNLIKSDQDLEVCGHGGVFSNSHNDCKACPKGTECHWLYQNGEYADLENYSLQELEQRLEFALDYVDSRILEWQHHSASCKCELCGWLRSARQLYEQALQQSEGSLKF